MSEINNNNLINDSQSLISLEQFDNKYCCKDKNVKSIENRANLNIITPSLSAPIHQPRRWKPKSSRPLANSEEDFLNFNLKSSEFEEGSITNKSNFIQYNEEILSSCFWKYSRVFGSSKKVIKSLGC